ncbi:hypothetical protein [Hyalangium gracile]|uniref:hypothetical protein n=1 Tax=Hyalangium gracile TaxID=394092 RepID=UPI001CCC6095|nr:hypothetical protein [Hyalangium gracile]
MDKRPLVLEELEHPVAPPTADVAALASVSVGSPSTAVIVLKATAVSVPIAATSQLIG